MHALLVAGVSVRPWWAPVVQWSLWGVAMALVMGWLARSRTEPTPSDAANTLMHPRSTLIIGLVCTGLFLVIAVLSAVFPGKTGSPALTLFFLGFAALGLPLVLDYRNARHVLTPDGLRYGKMFGGVGALRWAEVRRLNYSQSAKWFRLDLADGRVVRVSAMLIGLPNFALEALEQVPPSAITSEARIVLEATRAGNLPPIWG